MVTTVTASTAGPVDMRLVEVPALLRRRWKLITSLSALSTALVIAWLAIAPATYTVTSVFVPNSQNTSMDLAAITAGLGLGASTSNQSLDQLPAFYVDLLHSREMLGGLAKARVAGASGGETIAHVLGTESPNGDLMRETTADALTDMVHSSVLQRTGVVRLSVTSRQPELSLGIASQLLRMVDSFNIAKLQGRGASERRFATARVEQVTAELRIAENRLQSFLQQNRAYSDASQLVVLHDRLQREVALKQDLLATLTTTQARAEQDASRDTPVIAIVERPEMPARPDARGYVPLGLLAAVCGALLGVLIAHVGATRQRLLAPSA